MKNLFPQIADISVDPQVGAEMYFRGETATGLIEKCPGGNQSATLLFVGGEPLAAYLVEEGPGKPISFAEFSALPEEHARIVPLSGVAGRLAFLALESEAESELSVSGAQDWQRQSDQWRQTGWSGLVEIKSDDLHGFLLVWQGEAQKHELAFSTSGGFVHELPSLSPSESSAWQVTAYSHNLSLPAYRYTVLRQGAAHWSRAILARYQELVGQKFLQIMERELNHQIEPWRWKITLGDMELRDLHFFSHISDAAHAYRALFMAIGAQMDFVVGSHLTQKLLGETFEQVSPDERAALHAQRLIPAAFSE